MNCLSQDLRKGESAACIVLKPAEPWKQCTRNESGHYQTIRAATGLISINLDGLHMVSQSKMYTSFTSNQTVRENAEIVTTRAVWSMLSDITSILNRPVFASLWWPTTIDKHIPEYMCVDKLYVWPVYRPQSGAFRECPYWPQFLAYRCAWWSACCPQWIASDACTHGKHCAHKPDTIRHSVWWPTI